MENVRVTFLLLWGSQYPSAENVLDVKVPDIGVGCSEACNHLHRDDEGF